MSDLNKYYNQFKEDELTCEKEMDAALKKFLDKYYNVITHAEIEMRRGAYWNRHITLRIKITPEIIIK